MALLSWHFLFGLENQARLTTTIFFYCIIEELQPTLYIILMVHLTRLGGDFIHFKSGVLRDEKSSKLSKFSPRYYCRGHLEVIEPIFLIWIQMQTP